MRLRHSQPARNGIAAVELAIAIPVMMILALGTMETTDLIFLRQRLLSAAFEAARTATGPSQTSASGIAAGTAILTARGIADGEVTITPTVTPTTATGTEVTATATAPFVGNSCVVPFVLRGRVSSVSVSVTMVRQ
jgi:Flp pilus assembly protein TadG